MRAALLLALCALSLFLPSFVWGSLQIHVVPHTHDDVGWLKTVDEYFLGANNSIQDAGVQYILDSVVPQLEENPARRFIYVEMAFLYRWWNEQSASMKERVRRLVANGQLEFINGGWCMNDEATTQEEAIITQMSRGHAFLKKEFGAVPNIGWQIDPFGHSGTLASLMAQMGMDALFFARIDYQDYELRKQQSRLEWVWRPSQSLGAKTQIFTHAFWDTSYCYPPGFAFEATDPPINADSRLEDYNLVERADAFVKAMQDRSQHYRTNHILVTFGCDFQFQNAHINYKNMDLLLNYINANSARYGGINVQYSTPSIYVKAVNQVPGVTWPVKTDDLFPYADQPHSYWTGYFTSRPALKGYVRTRSALLQAINKVLSSAAVEKTPVSADLSAVDVLTQALSVAQHHDAVAGTEKQHVADDYAKRLARGTASAEAVLSTTLQQLVGETVPLTFCPFLNVTQCPQTVSALQQQKSVPVVLYNSLGWERSEFVWIPVPAGTKNVTVKQHPGGYVKNAVLPRDGGAAVGFIAKLPPMGYQSYIISPVGNALNVPVVAQDAAASNKIGNGIYNVTFGGDGRVAEINRVPVVQDFLWYNGSTGNGKEDDLFQASGAYIFRPNSSTPFAVNSGNVNLAITHADNFLSEAVLTFSSWVKMFVRVYSKLPFVELVSDIGPIPIEDGLGKEVISRFTTNIDSQQLLFTDSEGQEMQQRRRNFRPTWNLNLTEPVAANYYPVNVAAFIKSAVSQMTFLADRSHGVASLKDGQYEEMLHRRLLKDDDRGVGEALNETEAIRTTTRLVLRSPQTSAQVWRQLSMELNHPLVVAIAPPTLNATSWGPNKRGVWSGLTRPLPPNVHMISYETSDTQPNIALVRFRHLYAAGEDAVLSQPVTFSLDGLFTGRTVLEVVPMSLTANQRESDMVRLQWNTASAEQDEDVEEDSQQRNYVRADTITLGPMEIKTLQIRFDK